MEPTARPHLGSSRTSGASATRGCRVVPWRGRRVSGRGGLGGRASLLAGAWLFVSPWWIATTEAAAWNAWITGAAIAATSAVALCSARRRIGALNVLAATWLFVSPWVVPSLPAMAWNAWILAIIVCAAAAGGMRAVRRRHAFAPPVPIRFRRRVRRPWPPLGA